MNEPNLATMGGAPPGYDAAAYGRDVRLFDTFRWGRDAARHASWGPARSAKRRARMDHNLWR